MKTLIKIFLLLLFSIASTAGIYAQRTVTGTVVDKDQQPVVGVNVVVTGTTLGAITDIAGKYSIEIPQGARSLTFTFVGMVPQEISIGTLTQINVTMAESAIGLEEVIVIGYGTQRKRNVTAAISTIDVSNLKDIPAASVSRLLEGQTTGVTVKQTTGAPGKEFEVTIRGLGSLGAGSQPLYVIDGFPVGTSVGQNLNPNDIATITILKDAVSTAIYGARGSNGVMLITTKRAKAGEVNLSVTANYGIQNVPESRKLKVLNGPQFAEFKKESFMDKIRNLEHREPTIDEVPLDFRYPEQTKYSTNWSDAILNQNAAFRNYNITLSQGKGDIHSLVSVSYVGQEGALINTNYNNYSVRANIDGKINKFINMGLNVNGSYSKQNLASTEGRDAVVGTALLIDPRYPIYNEDGTYNSYIGGHDGVFGWWNPVQYLNEVTDKQDIGDLLSNGFLEFSFLKNFKFKSVVNAKLNFSSYKGFRPSTIAGSYNSPPPRDATESDNAYSTVNLSADQLLTYANEFGDHHLDVLLGYTAQEETVKGLSGSGTTYPDDLVQYLSAAKIRSSGSEEYGWSMAAYFGRLNYSYKGRYLFSGTFRREGSSRFGSINKYGNFPALSAGWRISDEPFMPKYSWLNDLKIRGSWGLTGNNNIGNYSSLAFMQNTNYIFGNNFVTGKVVGSFPNNELGWEKSAQTDIGLDLSLFDNKLTFTTEYYDRITSNMLLSIQLPAISGFTSNLGNVGKVQNKGFEFEVGYKTKINEIGFWSNFNISFNRNKILAIRGVNDEIWSGDMWSIFNCSKVGRPIGMIYGYKTLGIFQNQAEIDESPTQPGALPGVYKFADSNGDKIITFDTQDMVEIGNPWPKFTYGLTLGGDYKNFDLSVIFTGAQDYDLFAQIEKTTMNMDGVFNVSTEVKDRWRSEQNPGNGRIPTTDTWVNERESHSKYVYDASHLWVKNVSLGYTIPKSTLHFSSVRAYLSADNLFLFTSYPGNNPDVNGNRGISPGYDDVAYPVARTFSIGANITF